jgi:hypothetical protein
MNTIPTTFNERRIPYTVIGGPPQRSDALPISAVVLNRGGRQYNRDVFEALEKAKFSSIVSVESPAEGADLDAVASRHPKLRFVLVRDKLTPGEAVNIGIQESTGEFVLVLWSDMYPTLPFMGPPYVDRLREKRAMCVVPAFAGSDDAPVPGRIVPAFHRRRALKLLSIAPEHEGEPCLFPFDYCGFYRRDAFMLAGGYDYTIANPWWQKADFGFRTFLWGDRIRFDPSCKLSYSSIPAAENSTTDEFYARFYLKNVAPKFSGESGSLPYSLFLPFAARSGLGFFRSLTEFRLARHWIKKNSYLFRMDCSGITDLWEKLKP